MNILFLSQWFPFPPDNGSKIRIYHLLRGLSQFHDVTLFSFYNANETPYNRSKAYPFCSEIRLVPWKPFDAKSKKAAFGFFRITPRSLFDTHSSEMEAVISNAVSGGKFNLIIASQLTMASYYPAFAGVPAIFEEIELGQFFDRAFNRGSWRYRLRHQLTWFKLHKYFSRLLNAYQAYTVVSKQERDLFVRIFPKFQEKINVIPNCIHIEDYDGSRIKSNSKALIFSGSFTYDANYESMCWFVGEVFPLILEQVPDAHLVISGNHLNKPLPSQKNITRTGYVEDIKSLIASCSVSLAPILSGGGTRLKILEAMALGVPVVSTSKGAEGLGAQNGEHLLITDDPTCYAESVVKLLKDKTFNERLSHKARIFVKENYDWSSVMPRLLNLLEQDTIKRV